MKRILVIDDEPSLREVVNGALSHKGFEVIEAADGVAGLELAQSERPDLILCDVNMDKLDGYGTLNSLRKDPATAPIPFILMTGSADHAGMRHGMELGADDYLSKPFTIEGLWAAVEARLRKAQAMRDEAEQRLADLRDSITLSVPHELRTPLNGILAYGEILSSDAANLSPAEVAEMGQVIHASGKRLQKLVENFLIYAQLELVARDREKAAALRSRQTRTAARVLAEHAMLQAREAQRETDLLLDLSDTPVRISEEYLGKIVDELVENAFKFSAPGKQVRVTFGPAGDAVVLRVADQGRGFSTEHIRRIGAYMQFDRKLTEQQGLGLGLSIAKRLVEVHGGTLEIISEKGVCSSVVARFPL